MLTELTALCLSALLMSAGAAAAAASPLPHNTIHCEDWTHNPDGSWTAHADARPFDLGNTTGLTFQSTTIHPRDIAVGTPTFDLWEAVNEKCAKEQ